MAGYQNIQRITGIAGEDLAKGDQNAILTIENDGGVGKFVRADSKTETVVGVLADRGNGKDGAAISVTLLQGVVEFRAGAAITAGQILVADATAGRVAGVDNIGALGNDEMGFAVALATAADADIFPALALPLTSAANA